MIDVAVDLLAQSADLEVAHRQRAESADATCSLPTVAELVRAAQDVDAVRVEVGTERDVEQEQLGDDVGEVEQLDNQVDGDEVVAASRTKDFLG